jgi:cyclopropane-fatty-acyl-phospholipid synthase
LTTVLAPELSIDALRWPDVVHAGGSNPIRRVVARLLLRRAIDRLPLRVTTSTGDRMGAGGPSAPHLHLHRSDVFFERVGVSGLIGFGEAYMAGDWESEDLADVLTVLASSVSTLIPKPMQRLRDMILVVRPRSQDNSVEGARANIQRHYDLSNELFATFLDPSLSYSSALFDGDPEGSAELLLTAQHRKIDRLLDLAAVGAGTRVLEIGTGWGELAVRAARRGAKVTSVTISSEQATLARERIAQAGLADRAEVRLQDYREVTGEFDAVVSVEMIEAVGANRWPEYFGALDRLLAPEGKVALQAITMPHDRMLATRNTYTWIVKYIFPGGHIPSVTAVREQVASTRLEITSELAFGRHYAETLRRWRAAFEDRAADVSSLGFDQVFQRMWSLYLAYSEAGFRSRYLDVVQFGMVRRAGA